MPNLNTGILQNIGINHSEVSFDFLQTQQQCCLLLFYPITMCIFCGNVIIGLEKLHVFEAIECSIN